MRGRLAIRARPPASTTATQQRPRLAVPSAAAAKTATSGPGGGSRPNTRATTTAQRTTDYRHNPVAAAAGETKLAIAILENAVSNGGLALVMEHVVHTAEGIPNVAPIEPDMAVQYVSGAKSALAYLGALQGGKKAPMNSKRSIAGDVSYLCVGGGDLSDRILHVDMKRIFEWYRGAYGGQYGRSYDILRYNHDGRFPFAPGGPPEGMGDLAKGGMHNRGRDDRPESQILTRQNSYVNANAGISQLEDTPKEAHGWFPGALYHAKTRFQRAWQGDDARTAEKFYLQGAPFIGGGSGSAADIAFSLRSDFGVPAARLMKAPQKLKLLLVAGAMLVAGGHHSWTEVALGYRAFGFTAFLDPLADYPAFMADLEARLGAL